MAIHLEIKTDLRVKDLLPYILEVENIVFSYQIDSTNYGEGYELNFKDLELRLYDDDRSDETMMDLDFRTGKINWNEAFEKVVERKKGQGVLRIEVDRYEKHPEIQQEAKKEIVDNLNKNGFAVKEV